MPKKLKSEGTTSTAARVAGLAMMLLFPGFAHANQYLFSFTTSQLMAALQSAEGTASYNESAYFAIFIQPDPFVISNYTYTVEVPGNYQESNPWMGGTIVDPASPNLGYSQAYPCPSDCEWAVFAKRPDQTSVTVISGANGGAGGSNIFMNHFWQSNAPWPYGWGGTGGVITTIMPGSDVFRFVIDTSQTLSGSYTLNGYASILQSGSQTTMTGDTKEEPGHYFSLDVTPSDVPEPGAVGLFAAGGLVFGYRYRRTTSKNPRNRKHSEI